MCYSDWFLLSNLLLSGNKVFECNSLIVVSTVGNARSRVSVDSVACFYEVVIGYVFSEVTSII